MRRPSFFARLGLLLAVGALLPAAAEPDARYPRKGIDVSHHQGRIDWAGLPGQGISFAYMKATEGGSHRDRLFAANWAAAKAAGVDRGAYHYFTLCRSGADQAANFIATVPVDPAALAPAVDLEFLGNCGRRPSRDAFHADLAAFIRAVEARYGKQILLYLTDEFDRAYGVSARVNRPLWLRSLGREPDFGARPWSVWQLSHSKRIRGIATPVDWNVAR